MLYKLLVYHFRVQLIRLALNWFRGRISGKGKGLKSLSLMNFLLEFIMASVLKPQKVKKGIKTR